MIRSLFQLSASWVSLWALSCLADPVDRATSWPRFRGHDGDGVSAASGVPVELHKETMFWSAILAGPGSSSPAVWEDRVFVTSEDRTKGQVVLACLGADDGRERWTLCFDTGRYQTHRFNNAAASTPALGNDRVVCSWFDAHAKAVMLSAVTHDGKRAWEVNLGGFDGLHGPNLNPIVSGERVIVAHHHKAGGFTGAFSLVDGSVLWKHPYPPGGPAAYSTPLVRDGRAGREVVVTGTTIGMRALDFTTGQERWSLPGILDQRAICSPVEIFPDSKSARALIQAGCKEGTYLAVQPPATGTGEAADKPRVAWALAKQAPYVPTPVSDGATVHVLSDGGVLTAVAAATGKPLRQAKLPGNFYASPLLVAGRLYCQSRDGEMFVVEAGDSYKLLATCDLHPGSEVEWTDATPAIARGRLFVRVGARLDCYGSPPSAR